MNVPLKIVIFQASWATKMLKMRNVPGEIHFFRPSWRLFGSWKTQTTWNNLLIFEGNWTKKQKNALTRPNIFWNLLFCLWFVSACFWNVLFLFLFSGPFSVRFLCRFFQIVCCPLLDFSVFFWEWMFFSRLILHVFPEISNVHGKQQKTTQKNAQKNRNEKAEKQDRQNRNNTETTEKTNRKNGKNTQKQKQKNIQKNRKTQQKKN